MTKRRLPPPVCSPTTAPVSASVEDNMSCRTSAASGVRCLRYTDGAGRYEGRWLHNQHHGYGVKATKRGLIYEGQWRAGQRHGYGTLRRQCADGRVQRVFIGHWQQDVRCGEGKQYYENGDVYFGQWRNNQRHGRGIQWHPDGRIYVGEWQRDAKHGKGVLYAANGNRYVGEFENDCKSGAGVYYHHHRHSGQVVPQHGFWSDDICRTSSMPSASSSIQSAA